MTMINSAMGNNSREDRRELTPERWELIKAETVVRAQELRAQALRDFTVWLANRPAALLLGWAKAVGAWWTQRSAVRELQGLDNRTLRDMGIARSEIEYLVAGGDPERRLPRSVVAKRVPCAASGAARSRSVTMDRRAA
jgi:uncharacterized protein YjiS (DUF1127 family)